MMGYLMRSRPPSALEEWVLAMVLLVLFVLLAWWDGLMALLFPR